MKKIVQGLVCVMTAMLISACGLSNNQIVKTRSFGAATANVGKIGEKEFVNIRNGIIEMNKALVAIDNTKTSNSLVFDRPAGTGPTAKRVAAARALKLYGDLLVKLATDDRSGQLREAAGRLLDNTEAATGRDLSDDGKKALSGIIAGFGSLWIDRKKAAALKEIVPAYRQPVDKLADLLSEDFSIDRGALGYLKAYQITAKRLKNAAIRLVNAGSRYTVFERERAVDALVLADKAIARAKALSRTAGKAIANLKKANAELVKVVGKTKYNTDDIKAYARQIQELVNMYRVLAEQH